MAQPGTGAFGVPARERGRHAARRLRARCPLAAARAVVVAERRRDRHLAPPPRPLRRSRAVVVGPPDRTGRGDARPRALAPAARPRPSALLRAGRALRARLPAALL